MTDARISNKIVSSSSLSEFISVECLHLHALFKRNILHLLQNSRKNVFLIIRLLKKKIKKKTLWPLFMDGVQLPQG